MGIPADDPYALAGDPPIWADYRRILDGSQLSIPLLAGLSMRQARIVALMGRLETHAADTVLIEAGSESREICVVIEGQLAVWITDAHGARQHLRYLARGDLAGEVALFEGKRSANVESVSPVRVLWLSDTSLDRIKQRYPRIAAALYRNIGRVLAFRLADLTAMR